MFHVVVMPLVSAALGRFCQGKRDPLLAVLNRLYDQLENHANRYRGRRNAQRPDDYFDYLVNLFDEEGWHTLRFTVDDRQAADHLFVDGVSHRSGRFRV
jgi:hypothetical protein